MSDNEPKSGLGRIMQDKASRRLLMIGGGTIVMALGWAFLGNNSATPETSKVRPTPSISSTQGGSAISEQYRENLQVADQARVEQAKQTGGSAIATVVAAPTGDRLPTTLEFKDETPKKDVVVPQRPVPKQEVPKPAPVRPQPPSPPSARAKDQQTGPAVDAHLLSAMQGQMGNIMNGVVRIPVVQTEYFYTNTEGRTTQQGGAGGGAVYPGQGTAAAYSTQQQPGGQQASGFRPPVAGTILYARLIGRVNSDVPGPVLAEILQGPFAGARLLGTFATGEEGVLISFKTMTVGYEENGMRHSEVVPIDAVAVDAAHLGTAMATDIDRHLFEKVAFGFATSFLQGLGQAISNSGSTTVIRTDGSSVTDNPLLSTKDKLLVAGGEAARSTGDVISQEFGNRKTTITVEANTAFGLLFLGTGH